MNQSNLGKLYRMLNDFQAEMDKLPPALKDELGQYFKHLAASIDSYNEFGNKQAVYQAVAKFLQLHFRQPPHVCLAAAYNLCGEKDPRFLNKLPLRTHGEENAVERLSASARGMILGVKVYFAKGRSGEYLRTTEVWFAEQGKPAAFTREEQVEWDHLTEDVRESFLREGASRLVFKVYPKE